MIQNKLSLNLSISDNLKHIPGFGPHLSNQLCYKLGISPDIPLSSISNRKKDAFIRMVTEISKNTTAVNYKDQWTSNVPKLLIDASLIDSIRASKKKQINMNTIKGSHLSRGLPSRGQRTKTNAKTAKKRQI